MLKTLATALAVFGLAASPVTFECPDQVVEPAGPSITYGPDTRCGSLEFNYKGMRLGGPGVGCPQFAVVTPPRDKTKHQPGSNTYTRPAGTVAVTLLTFSCDTEWFLIIPVGSRCVHSGTSVIARLTNYEQLRCPDVEETVVSQS